MNYYDILNISRDSDQLTIKKAYRKLALKWHPDKNPDNKELAEKKFKDISEAYQILSDSTKKDKYDLYGETPDKFKSPEELFSQLFSDLDPVIGNFLTNTLSKITKSFMEDSNKGIWDVVNEINKEEIIEGGSNVVKDYFIKRMNKNSEKKHKHKIFCLKLKIEDIDFENDIDIDIEFARKYSHIQLEISSDSINKNYLLDIEYIEHTITFSDSKYTFFLIDKFPPKYIRYNNYNLVLEYDVNIYNYNQGFRFYYPYTSKDYIECNIIIFNKSNIVKIPNKGLLNIKTDKLGDLFIIFNPVCDEHSIKEDSINNDLETYYSLDPLLLLKNI